MWVGEEEGWCVRAGQDLSGLPIASCRFPGMKRAAETHLADSYSLGLW